MKTIKFQSEEITYSTNHDNLLVRRKDLETEHEKDYVIPHNSSDYNKLLKLFESGERVVELSIPYELNKLIGVNRLKCPLVHFL